MIALSAGEADYYGIVKAAPIGLGFAGMMRELGCEGVKLRVSTDASAGKAMTTRIGTGQVIHLEVSQLWVQDKVRKGELELRKVNGLENPADKLTKYMGREGLDTHFRNTGVPLGKGGATLLPRSTRRGRTTTLSRR